MPEENGNGKNGKATGVVERLKSAVQEDLQALKTDLPAKAKEQVDRKKKKVDKLNSEVFDLKSKCEKLAKMINSDALESNQVGP